MIDFKFSPCEENNYHKIKLNTMINKITSHGDSLLIDITWVDNCNFDPELSLNIIKGDTIYFNYRNREEDEPATCWCPFRFKITLTKIKKADYQIKIGSRKIDKNSRRYLTDGYVAEYFPGRTMDKKKCREIYFDDGYLVTEVFYNKEGDIISEKFYEPSWGFFLGERKY